MKAIVLTSIRQMERMNVPEPTMKKDDEVLFFHDATVNRTTEGKGFVTLRSVSTTSTL